uniref:Uncharacterized protein n=1 Tax=Anguilla anguilla TaxID=7936 RepID=A0A0E9V4N4_ANGAN
MQNSLCTMGGLYRMLLDFNTTTFTFFKILVTL